MRYNQIGVLKLTHSVEYFMGTFTINIQCGPEGDEEKEPIIYAR